MAEFVTWQSIVVVLGIAGTIFTIYKNYFASPDEKAATNDAVLSVQILGLSQRLDKALTNDMPHIDAKVESLRLDVQEMGKTVIRLATIIDERIPKKNE